MKPKHAAATRHKAVTPESIGHSFAELTDHWNGLPLSEKRSARGMMVDMVRKMPPGLLEGFKSALANATK